LNQELQEKTKENNKKEKELIKTNEQYNTIFNENNN